MNNSIKFSDLKTDGPTMCLWTWFESRESPAFGDEIPLGLFIQWLTTNDKLTARYSSKRWAQEWEAWLDTLPNNNGGK